MARVTLDKICREFAGRAQPQVAVADLDIAVCEGEFLALLGPSGCGKSTTLRMIAGLEQPTSGRIMFDGRPVNHLAPADRNVAMVFQNYALYPHMTVRGNLEYPLRKRGVAAPARAVRTGEVAALLQLGPLLDRKPSQLSGGQQQRVALGRALIRDPQVFLLDEPLSNLDAKLRSYMRAELIQLQRRVRTTTIYVTHDQLEAMTMSDRIAVMDQGRLQQIGSPAEVYERPANRVVAGFVGTPSMNLLEMEITTEGGRCVLRRIDMTIVVPPEQAAALPAGQSHVLVGVRPDDIAIGAGSTPATIIIVEPTGHETLVILRVGSTDLTARVPPDLRLRPGSAVLIDIRSDKLHLFDLVTGNRLPALSPSPLPHPRSAAPEI
jgi:multiple sugar transport system ATP-binding protein